MLIDYNYKQEFVGLTFFGLTSYSYTLPKSNRGIIFKDSSSAKEVLDDNGLDYKIILKSLTFLDPENNEINFELSSPISSGGGIYLNTSTNIVSNYYHQYPIIASSPTNTIATTESIYLNSSGTVLDEIFLPIKIKKLNFLIDDWQGYGLPAPEFDWSGVNPFTFTILY